MDRRYLGLERKGERGRVDVGSRSVGAATKTEGKVVSRPLGPRSSDSGPGFSLDWRTVAIGPGQTGHEPDGDHASLGVRVFGPDVFLSCVDRGLRLPFFLPVIIDNQP